MKKLFFIFIHLSYFILGNTYIAIAEPLSYGPFSEVIRTIDLYKTDLASFNNELITRSLDGLTLNIVNFYHSHKLILPVDYTSDSAQPFEAFDSCIITELNKQIILIKFHLTEAKDDLQSPALISRSIEIINGLFESAVNRMLNFKDTNLVNSFSHAKEYSPTHLYALLNLYLQEPLRFSDENLPKDNLKKSMSIFRYFLESKGVKGTFADYFKTLDLPESEYNKEILEALFKAQKI